MDFLQKVHVWAWELSPSVLGGSIGPGERAG